MCQAGMVETAGAVVDVAAANDLCEPIFLMLTFLLLEC